MGRKKKTFIDLSTKKEPTTPIKLGGSKFDKCPLNHLLYKNGRKPKDAEDIICPLLKLRKHEDLECPLAHYRATTDKTPVVIYARTSTKTEAQKTSIIAQPQYAERYLNRGDNKGKYSTVATFTDWGKSGTTMLRAYFCCMLLCAGVETKVEIGDVVTDPRQPDNTIKQLTYIYNAKENRIPLFDRIIIKSTSRFARNSIEGDRVITALSRKGVYLTFTDLDLKTDNPNDVSNIRNCLHNDDLFSVANSQKSIDAYQLKKENHELVSNPRLYGYDYHKRDILKDIKPHLTINKKEAEVVRFIFNTYAYGYNGAEYGIRKLAKLLPLVFNNFDHLPSGSTTINKMLENEKYLGMVNTGKVTTGTLKNKIGYAKITSDYKKYMRKSSDVEQIIEEELWDAVQTKKRERLIIPKATDGKSQQKIGLNTSKNKFTKLLVCSQCNSTFRYDNNSGNPFYTCANKDENGINACNINNVYLYHIDKKIEELRNGEYNAFYVDGLFKHLMSTMLLIKDKITKTNNTSTVTEIEALEQKIKNDKLKLDAILDDDDSDITILSNLITTLKSRIKANMVKIDSLKATPDEIMSDLQSLIYECDECFSYYQDMQPSYTEDEILDRLDKIIVYGIRPATKFINHKPLLIPIFKNTYSASNHLNVRQYEYTINKSADHWDRYDDYIADKELNNALADYLKGYEDFKVAKKQLLIDDTKDSQLREYIQFFDSFEDALAEQKPSYLDTTRDTALKYILTADEGSYTLDYDLRINSEPLFDRRQDLGIGKDIDHDADIKHLKTVLDDLKTQANDLIYTYRTASQFA